MLENYETPSLVTWSSTLCYDIVIEKRSRQVCNITPEQEEVLQFTSQNALFGWLLTGDGFQLLFPGVTLSRVLGDGSSAVTQSTKQAEIDGIVNKVFRVIATNNRVSRTYLKYQILRPSSCYVTYIFRTLVESDMA